MKNKTIEISPNISDSGKRLDIFLTEKFDLLTRSSIKKLINLKKVKINDEIIELQSKKIKEKDKINISLETHTSFEIKPSKKKVQIVFEDKDLIVIDKPQGMVVHPGAGNKDETLVNILIGRNGKNLSDLSGTKRPGIVHRIDKNTSGLLVIAKNNFTHANLGKQFSDHTIKRKYLALIWNVIRPLKGTIETFITRNKRNRKIMTNHEFKGKKAITNYSTLKVFSGENIPKISLMEFKLETGRTHQIRVHMNYKGTSLIGDEQYSRKNYKYKKIDPGFKKVLEGIKGQVLHASYLGFTHPRNSKNLEFEAKLPKNFEKLVKFLDKLKN